MTVAWVLLGGAAIAAAAVRFAPSSLRAPLVVFNVFYILTSAIGATLIVHPEIRLGWALLFPSMDASWLSPGAHALYWIAVWGPLVISNGVALFAIERVRRPAVLFARVLDVRPDLVTCLLVGGVMIGYCLLNLAMNGLLGVGLLSGESTGDYRENIVLRSQMAATLGDTHYGLIYMAIPAVCLVALQRAVKTASASWWTVFTTLTVALVFLYTTTLTKGNLVVFGLALVIGAVACGLLRAWGTLLAGAAGLLVLTLQDFLLSGGNPLEFVRTVSNVVLRMASGIPFYLEAFPQQLPFVGLDVGLSRFGIGPSGSPNLLVSNLMFPGDTWVQGAVPAPAHIAGYAQGGLPWSLLTMALVGVLIGFAGALRRAAYGPLAFSAFVGICIAVYNTTQTDFVGVFAHSYGYKWWLLALAVLAITQRLLEFVMLASCDDGAGTGSAIDRGVSQT